MLLSPGAGSAVSSEQSFLARRMGIPMVQGGDLLVLDDCVYLKTVRGLERVEVIYNRVADAWLDPLVFRRDSVLGVPGLVHCLRKGTVALVNAVGSQLADDRTLLAFAAADHPLLSRTKRPSSRPCRRFWLGDIDQREDRARESRRVPHPARSRARTRTARGSARAGPDDESRPAQEIREAQPGHFVAQPREEGATTICFPMGSAVEHPQDHIVFAVRTGTDFECFPAR